MGIVVGLAAGNLLTGCSWHIDSADREVQRLIEGRQAAALGETHSADQGKETGAIGDRGGMYDFVPHPVDPKVPEAFRPTVHPADKAEVSQTTITQPTAEMQVFTLTDCFAYAQKHARAYQTAKENLYLKALDLTLERHLWTPRFSGSISSQYANYGQIRDFDHAMDAVSQVAVEQRLPLGGTVTARLINDWVRDLGKQVTVGESGQMILEADIPLLRGAGKVAYESRYQAERNLIYAVRDFERFRRTFLVQVAGDYFNLLSAKTPILSAKDNERSFKQDMERTLALAKVGDVLQVDADRAQVEYLQVSNLVVVAEAGYQNRLDRFKILLGMPTTTIMDVGGEESLDLKEPQVDQRTAIDTALKYRLDLLNDLDAVDDTRRGVLIARNNMLPDVNLSGSVRLDTNPYKTNSVSYNTERATWRAMLQMEIPFDRVAERNDYRASLISLRRSQRWCSESTDTVCLEVRQALRALERTRVTMEIQHKLVPINDTRRELARLHYKKGRVPYTDVVDAEKDWRDAVNVLAQAQADYRLAILQFFRDTGTLRVHDDGRWSIPEETL
ncbi:MAG: TolC family protein [Phycisphaerae bacterium]|nr:TolC family protein [Phycisphaerae bacterium]